MNDPLTHTEPKRPRRIPFWIRKILRESSTYPSLRDARRAARRVGRKDDFWFQIGWMSGYEGQVASVKQELRTRLRERFGTIPADVKAKLRATTDLAKLQTALRQVIHINSPAELPF